MKIQNDSSRITLTILALLLALVAKTTFGGWTDSDADFILKGQQDIFSLILYLGDIRGGPAPHSLT